MMNMGRRTENRVELSTFRVHHALLIILDSGGVSQ